MRIDTIEQLEQVAADREPVDVTRHDVEQYRFGRLIAPRVDIDQAWSAKLLENLRSMPLSGSMNDSRFASNCNGVE